MVLFVLTRTGYIDTKSLLNQKGTILWVNDNVLTDNEITDLRAAGFDVTRFTSHIALEQTAISDAVSTIREHHPHESIWVEAADEQIAI